MATKRAIPNRPNEVTIGTDSLVIPLALLHQLLRVQNEGDEQSQADDLEDFADGARVFVRICECESGTGFTIQRDRRKTT